MPTGTRRRKREHSTYDTYVEQVDTYFDSLKEVVRKHTLTCYESSQK